MKDKGKHIRNKINYYSHSLFYRLAGRTAFLLNCMQIGLMVLFIAGNFQGFMDSTIATITLISTIVAIPGIIFNLVCFVTCIVMAAVYHRPVFALQFVFFLFGFVLQTVALVLFRVLIFISNGMI